jgi:hypothetical protein
MILFLILIGCVVLGLYINYKFFKMMDENENIYKNNKK